jgi:hypothetical protein
MCPRGGGPPGGCGRRAKHRWLHVMAVGGVNALHLVTSTGRPSGNASKNSSRTSVPWIGHLIVRCTRRTLRPRKITNNARMAIQMVVSVMSMSS